MSINGRLSASKMLKAAAAGDGVGINRHSNWGKPQHDESKYTDAEVAYMELRGHHVDRVHALVYSALGRLWTPLHVATM